MRPAYSHAGAGFYKSGTTLMSDDRLLPDRIDRESGLVADAPGIDLYAAGVAVEDERHRHECLQSVVLGAAAGRDIRLAAGNANREIQDILDHLRRESWTIVDDDDPVRAYADGDLGRDPGFLTAVESVVDQLLHHHERPIGGRMSGLRRQLFRAGEVEQAAGTEGRAVQLRHS